MSDTTTSTGITTPTAAVPERLTGNQMFIDNMLLLSSLFAIFYFLLIRPQQKRLKAHRSMLGALTKGQRVITSGGLIGTIIKFEGEDVVVVEVAANVRVRIAKSAITDVTKDSPSSDSANDN